VSLPEAPAWDALFSALERKPADAATWADLYTALWPYLADWVVSRFGLDAATAADVLQDALLDYRAKASAGRIPHPSLAHVRAFVRLAALTALRRQARLLPLEDVHDTPADPEQELLVRLLVDQTLDRLDGRCAYLLRSRYYEGRSSAEIAKIMRVEPGHVDVMLHRCRARLRELMQAAAPQPL
jgi:RNA polymerase sigma factor (sigma-70 family)